MINSFFVSNIEMGVHLEPVVRLKKNKVFGYEVLSRAKLKGAYDYELIFSSLTVKEQIILLEKQLDILFFLHGKSCPQKNELYYFINITRGLLSRDVISLLYRFSRYFNIALELDESEGDNFSPTELELLSYCKRCGMTIWLDDCNGTSELHSIWDGVKLDKQAFWSFFEESPSHFEKWLVSSLGRMLIVEGVAEQAHLDWLSRYPIFLGQGYYWPGRTLT
ncbi:EAL domain-containing protein [Aeromonas veronii]|uniref:EAL domain-containing protein n=1 Tax=Aeromonas veronii TaxID=654 RepID=UPI001C5B2B96|nr:EAL domain-containing protein [Aeromonas veronii]MBW3781449.1 EAL domain-containing protein [Aeromonas veronii]